MTAELLRSIPKVQLHCHLEGTLRASTFVDLAGRHGVALTYRRGQARDVLPAFEMPEDPEAVYRFADFQEFLMTFAAVSRALAEPADYGRLAAEYVEDALAHNVAYAEVFISPSVWQFFHPDMDVRACVRAMRDAFDTAKAQLDVHLIADVTRNFGAESAMQTVRIALDMRDLGVIGIGLGGDEARYPAELFESVYAFARKEGLHTVAHAGEAAGAQSVRAAVEILGAERIGHGIRALEDPSVVDLLAARRIPLEVCPTSNMLTGVAQRGEPHPLVQLDAAGCVVTIDTDDPALFCTSITDEYAYVAQIAGVQTLLRFAANAVDASFAAPERKAALHRRLEPYRHHVGP
ncbi:MAG TPA: adenosine deaminase [Candidatus Baltobacteraceae bacterium]|nr:adenosine deaminase [Candidatus Baltobacteraceae bacterium]